MKKQIFIKAIALSIMLCSANTFTRAQAPNILWQKVYGGSDYDGNPFGRITALKDGNYLRVGQTYSSDGDFASTVNRGSADAYVIKFKPNGKIIWIKTFGGSAEDNFNGVIENPDHSLLIVGNTYSNDGDVSGNHGDNDGWVVKLSANGTLLSQHCFGGSGDDNANDVVRTNGNCYALAGWSSSNDGDINNGHGGQDAWVVMLNQNAVKIWSKSFGGSNDEIAVGILSTQANKLIINGFSASADGDMQNYHGGDNDVFAMAINSSGTIAWSNCYGGSNTDYSGFHSGIAKDGNLLISGSTYSTDDDANGNHGGADSWIVKVNNVNGNVLWSKCFGTAHYEFTFGIMTLPNGDLVALGITGPDDEIFGNSNTDAQAIRMDKNGNQIWTKTFGGSDYDEVEAGVLTSDGDLLLLGLTMSDDGGITNYHGEKDLWLVKLDANNCGQNHREASQPMIHSNTNLTFSIYPNPISISTTISFFLDQPQRVTVKIFDVQGRVIKVLADAELPEGENQLKWDKTDDKGGEVYDALYFLSFTSNTFFETKIVSVVK